MSNFNDFINNLDESRKITLKRRYTENHPAVEVGKVARVRNKMLEAIADGKITQEEFNAILKEFSADSGKWMRRNAKYFSVSEDGISLSKFGKRALSSITVNESEEILFEAEVEMDAMDPDNKDFLKFLKKNRVKIIGQSLSGPAGGHPVITMQGKKKDLEKVLGDCEYGWCDDELAEYIYESVVNELEESYSEREITEQEPSKEAEKLRKSVGGKAYWSRKEDVTDAGEYIIRYEMIKDGDAPYGLIILYYPPKQNKPYTSSKNGEFAIERWSDGTELYYGEDYKKAEAAIMKHAKTYVEESAVSENYEVIYSDGVSAMKKFRSEAQALDFMKKTIASNKKLRDIAVYKPGMYSTTQTEYVVSFWGNGSYLDNVSKKDPKLAAKKLEESVVNETVVLKKGDKVRFKNGESIIILGPKGDGYDYRDGREKGHNPKAWFDMMISSGKAVVESEVTEGRAFVAAARKAKDEGKEEFEYDGKTYPVTLKEGRAFVAAAKKAKDEGKEEFEYDGKSYPVTIKEENKTKNNKMENKRMFESFSNFVNNLSVTEAKSDVVEIDIDFAGSKADLRRLSKKYNIEADEYNPGMVMLKGDKKDILAYLTSPQYDMDMRDIEDLFPELLESTVNEAFSSMKLQSILTSAGSMPKDFAKTFYQMAKIQLDKIQDVDIIEMDPEQARKEKRNRAVYLYFTTNEKPNPYAGSNSWGVTTIPGNTLLGVTDGSNEWLAAEYSRGFGSKNRTKSLAKTKRNDGAGFGKSAANDSWGSGISSLSKVAELADRAYVLDLDILRARYSTEAQRDKRTAAKAGATAFKSDKDFKKENLARYHDILANRAAAMPIDKEVLKAIDVVTAQIKDGLTAGKKGKWGDVVIGNDPKGREVKLRDASNAMQNLLDDFNRYVDYTNQAKREEEAGYGSNYYSREVKNYAKSIKDRISKIEKMDYAW